MDGVIGAWSLGVRAVSVTVLILHQIGECDRLQLKRWTGPGFDGEYKLLKMNGLFNLLDEDERLRTIYGCCSIPSAWDASARPLDLGSQRIEVLVDENKECAFSTPRGLSMAFEALVARTTGCECLLLLGLQCKA